MTVPGCCKWSIATAPVSCKGSIATAPVSCKWSIATAPVSCQLSITTLPVIVKYYKTCTVKKIKLIPDICFFVYSSCQIFLALSEIWIGIYLDIFLQWYTVHFNSVTVYTFHFDSVHSARTSNVDRRRRQSIYSNPEQFDRQPCNSCHCIQVTRDKYPGNTGSESAKRLRQKIVVKGCWTNRKCIIVH